MLAFLEQSPYGNFVQAPANSFRVKGRRWRTQLVGLWRNDELVAVASLLGWRTPFGYEYECLQGPVLDYDDTALVNEVVRAMRRYVKQQGGISLRLQPPVVVARGFSAHCLYPDVQGQAAVAAIRRAGFSLMPTDLTDGGVDAISAGFIPKLWRQG